MAGAAAAAAIQCGGSSGTESDALSPSQIKAAEAVLQQLVSTNAIPGVICSIGNRRRVLAQGAFGLRSIETNAPMNAQTRNPLASVSKQFVAAAAFLLQEQGALSMDAPLSDYVPDYTFANQMTMTQVLTMRSGIAARDIACEAPVDGEINEASLLANLNQEALDFPPGKYFAYSNCAYNLAGVAIARITGMSCNAFIEKYFFKPLGMTSSYPLGELNPANFAQGYDRQGTEWRPESPAPADAAFSSGNLVSIPADMQRWSRSLLNMTVLSPDTIRQMYTLPDTPDTVISHYASGWLIEPSGIIWHPGALNGYGTVHMLFPMTGHAITLLSNTGPSEVWDQGKTALAMYNAAALGPTLPPLLPKVKTTVPSDGTAATNPAGLFPGSHHRPWQSAGARLCQDILLETAG